MYTLFRQQQKQEVKVDVSCMSRFVVVNSLPFTQASMIFCPLSHPEIKQKEKETAVVKAS